MKKLAPPATYSIFLAYLALSLAAPDFMPRATAPLANAAAAVFSSTLRMLLTSRAAAACAGVLFILAAASAALSILTKKKNALTPAYSTAKTAVMIMLSCLGVAAIVIAPALDTTYNLIAIALLLAAWPAVNNLHDGNRGKAAAVILAFAAAVCASATGALNGRTHLLFAAAAALAPLAPRISRKPAGNRTAFAVLSAACLIGANGYINMPPAPLCKSWKPNPRVRLVIPKPDAFDLVTSADGTIFATFKDGTVLKRGPLGGIQTLRLGAPAQRLALNEQAGLLYVAAYKSRNPLVIIDTATFRVRAAAVEENCAATSVALDESGSRVFFNCESIGKIVAADALTGKTIRAASLPRGSNIYSLAYNRGTLYASSSSLDPRILSIDPDTLEVKSSARAGFCNQGLAVDGVSGKMYLARVFAMRADVFTMPGLKKSGSVRTGAIPRDVQPAGGGSVLVSGYAGGSAVLADASGKTVAEWQLPPRARGVWRAPGGASYAACSCGIVELLP